MPLRLLHLSDIHFSTKHDEEKIVHTDVRHQLLDDFMKSDQAAATSQALAQQVAADWANPSVAAGFASLDPKQVEKLYKRCTKAHHPSNPVSGGGKGGYGGSPFWLPPGWDEFDFLGLLNNPPSPAPKLE